MLTNPRAFSGSTIYMIVLWISIIIFVSHIVVSCIDFIVNFFVSKVYARIKMTKKNALILGRKGPSWCLTPSQLRSSIPVGGVMFLLFCNSLFLLIPLLKAFA
jgi:hypothetical protein